MAGDETESDADAGKKGPGAGAGERLLRVISHPIRVEILRVLRERVASPKELARELGEGVSNVSYHFKYLRKEGCIEIVETEQRRGAIEHYYRARNTAPSEDEAWVSFDWTAIELDERGWGELAELQAAWVRGLEQLGSDAAARLAVESGRGTRVIAGVTAFETPPSVAGLAPSRDGA